MARTLAAAIAALVLLPAGAQAQAPALHWPLDSYSGNPNGAANTPDLSANNYPGAATVFQPLATGRFGNAMRLPALYQGAGSGIRRPAAAFLESSSLSTVVWVRSGSAPVGDRPIATYNEQCTDRAWRLRSNAGAVSFEVKGASGLATSATIPAASLWDGGWHGIAATYNGTTTRIFLDGAQVGADAVGQGAIQFLPLFSGPPGPAVGAPSQGSCANEHSEIDVDDFRIYTSALTVAQAQYLTNRFHVVSPSLPTQAVAAPDLAARYPLDQIDDDGVDLPRGARDTSGLALHGRDVDATLAGGRFLNAFTFDGSADGFRVPFSSLLEPQGVLTVMAWVRRTGAAGAHQTIVGKSQLGCDHAFALDTADNGGVGFTARQVTGDIQRETPEVPAAVVWDGEWHAVAGVIRNNIATLWLDGYRMGSVDMVGNIDYGTARALHVGRNPGCASRDFAGTVDDVRLYRRALNTIEIEHLHDRQPGSGQSPTELPAPTDPGDLRVRYRFDRATNHQQDSSPNELHAGATETVQATDGRFGGALRFPAPGGVPPRVSSGAGQMEPANALTLSLWVRGTNAGNARNIVQYGSGLFGACDDTPAYELDTTDTGRLRFSVFAQTAGVQSIEIDPADVFDGRWHLVTGTYNGQTRLYLDGARIARSPEFTGNGGTIVYPSGQRELDIGFRQGSSCNQENAVVDLDELRIYGQALSAAQVAYLARKYHATPPTSAIPGGDPGGLGLVAQYHLNALYPGGLVQDSSDRGHTGTGSGTVGQGRFRNAFTDPRVVVPDAAALRPNTFTAMAWVRRNNGATGPERTILGSNADVCNGHTWAFDTGANGGLRFYVNTLAAPAGRTLVATSSVRPTTIWDARWHAVAATYDGDDVQLWLDGKIVQSVDGPNGVVPDYAFFATKGLGIGRSPHASCPSDDFTGSVDEVRLYDRVLSESELRYLHNRNVTHPRTLPTDNELIPDPTNPPAPQPEPDLALKWHLDDFFDDGATPDASGNELSGRAGNAQPIGSGRFGGALAPIEDGVLRFPEDDDGPGEAENDPELRPDNVTLLTWVRHDGAPAAGQWLAGYEIECGGSAAYGLVTTGAGIKFVTQRGETPVIPNSRVFDGQWHAVAAIYDNKRIRIFVDGVQAGPAETLNTSGPLLYGVDLAGFSAGSGACAGQTFGGDLDEVRVYGRALTPRELRWLQDPSATEPRTLPAPTVPAGGLLVKYHVDEVDFSGNPQTPDSSPNDFDGVNFSRFNLVDGKWGKALDLLADPVSNPDPNGFVANAFTAPAMATLEPDAVTTMAWVRSSARKGRATMIAKGTLEAGATPGCDHSYALTTSPDGNLRFTVTVLGINGTHQRLNLDAPVSVDLFDNDWHAVAGSFGGGRMVLYHEGFQVAAQELDPALDGIDYQSYTQFRELAIGNGRGNCGFNEVWPGAIDEARVYAGALAPEEIAYLQRDEHRTPPDLPIPTDPGLNERPVMTGIPKVGSTLTCTPGTYSGSPITNRVWLWEFAPRSTRRQSSPAWKPINGAADAPTYTVRGIPVTEGQEPDPTNDPPSRIRCREIVSNAGGSAEGVSNNMRADFDKPVPKAPAFIPGPQVVDTIAEGHLVTDPDLPTVLECNPPEWENGPDPLEYFWTKAGAGIPGANAKTYALTPTRVGRDIVNPDGDGGRLISCFVNGYNDVGFDTTPPAPLIFAVDGKPLIEQPPGLRHVNPTEPNPLQWIFECGDGTWIDDPAAVGVADWGYTYKWLRNGNEIAGETGKRYTVTADTLGRDLECRSAVRNPAGAAESDYSASPSQFVALPQGQATGKLTTAFRNNEFDPMNLLAVSDAYAEKAAIVYRQLQERAILQEKQECLKHDVAATWNENHELLKFGELEDRFLKLLNVEELCKLVLSHTVGELQRSILYFPNQVRWRPLPGQPNSDCLLSFGTSEFEKEIACPFIDVPIQPVTAETEARLPVEQQQLLANVIPQRVLWDVDGDGRTDISCPGTSPVIRGMYDKGRYKVNAIIVNPDSLQTGTFVRVRPEPSKKDGELLVDFPGTQESAPGILRDPQPLWCRNSITPPPDRKTGPCTNNGTIGRVQLVGNLCPMNVRGITQANIDALPKQLRDVIKKVADAVNAREKAEEERRPDYNPGFKTAWLLADTFPTQEARTIAATAINGAAAQSGIAQAQQGLKSGAEAAAEQAFNQADGTINEAKQFAMDQLYTAAGAVKVNGVQYIPGFKDGQKLSTLLIPSDTGRALDNGQPLAGMTLSSPVVDKGLGVLDLAERKGLDTVVEEQIKDPRKLLETIRPEDLLGKIDLGPFEFAKGAPVQLKMRDDGTAQIDTKASFPALFSPSGGEITTEITLVGDLNGRLELEKLRFKIDDAFLALARVRGLDVSYDQGTLKINGELLFPGIDAGGIEIKDVIIDKNDRVRSFGVTYTPFGPGIVIGPAVFLTKLGGSFATRPNQPNAQGVFDPARTGVSARAGISAIAPGVNGCPTVGIDGGAGVYWDPSPWKVELSGAFKFICVPVATVDFDLWGNGKMTVVWDQKLSAGPIEYGWSVEGALATKPNRWMIAADGEGTILGFGLEIKGVISNKGAAFCGSILIFSGGAALNFPGGSIPSSFSEFVKNLEVFSGCGLGPWKITDATFRRGTRQAGSTSTFKIPRSDDVVPLRFQGSGGVPEIVLASPSGKVYDFTGADPAKQLPDKSFGADVENTDRTAVFLTKPETGTWTVATPPGSAPVVRVETAEVLPDPKVTGKIVKGAGPSRMLKYDARKIPGQEIQFVEIGGGPGMKILKTIKDGGKGKFRFTVSEASGTARRIEAQVTQDGLPRTNVIIARFSAPSPKVGKPKVRLRRKGSKVFAKWGKAALAYKYDVQVDTSDGEGTYIPRTKSQRTIVVDDVGKRETVKVTVVAISPTERRGKPGVAKSKGKRAKAKKKRKRKRRH